MIEKIKKSSICILLALVLAFTSMSTCFADSAPAYQKQEVVYVNLQSNGDIKDVYVVNIFDLDEDGNIIDYGDYEELRNMTTNDYISFSNETVSINTDKKSLYYEGKIKGNATPWKFTIKYFIDGKEVTPKELGGASGKLKITIGIAKNDEKYLKFFDHYTLQMTAKLNSELAKNIVAEGATIANVGKDRQLTYIVFPGTEAEYEITADVTDFKMEGLAINGIKMDLGLDADALSGNATLTSSLAALTDGARRLDSGAAALLEAMVQLSDGAKELADSTDILLDGSIELYKGASKVYDGATQISDGAYQLYSGAKELAGNSPLLNTLSDLIFDTNIDESRELINKHGYEVDENTSLETLQAYLEKRQNELVGDAKFMAPTMIEAIQLRYDEVIKILAQYEEGSKEYEYYSLASLYLRLAMFSVELNAAGENLEQQFEALSKYSELLLEIGGINVAEEYNDRFTVEGVDPAYKALADSEYELIYKYVESLIVKQLCKDSIYRAIAMLLYCKGVKTYTAGVDSIYGGAYSLYSGTAEMKKGALDLKNGASNLSEGMRQLSNGANELYSGTVKVKEGCIELKDGTRELLVNVSANSKGLISKIIEAVEDAFGADFAPESYVDERNNEYVDMVQFVFNFEGITIPKVVVPDVIQTKPTFWQKLLKLFGIEK